MDYLSFGLIIALIICIVVIIIISHRFYKFSKNYSNFRVNKKIVITELYDKIQTGDIILFAYTGFTPSNVILSQTFYTHCGVLFRKNNIVYISETNRSGLEYMPASSEKLDSKQIKPPEKSIDEILTKNGVDMIPLLSRLKYYTGDCYIMQLSKPLDNIREKLLLNEIELLNKEEYPYPSVIQSVAGIIGFKIEARHCWQHITHLLIQINLLSHKLYDVGFLDICDKIANLSGVKLSDNYMYKNVKQILYNI